MGMTAILSVASNVVLFPPVVTDQITQAEPAIISKTS
jgi:hypothetical protein